jgi:hypothetical protein
MKAQLFLVRPKPVRNAVRALLRKDTLIIFLRIEIACENTGRRKRKTTFPASAIGLQET